MGSIFMVKKKFTTKDKIKIAELYIHNEPGSLLYRLIGADAHIRPYNHFTNYAVSICKWEKIILLKICPL